MDECYLNRKSSRWYFMTELGITEYDLTAENAIQEESHEVNSTIKSESSSPSYSPHSNETPRKKAPTGACIFGLQKNNESEQQKEKGLLDRITFLVSGGEVIPMIDGVPQGYSSTSCTESISHSGHNQGLLHARKPFATGGDGSHQSRDLGSTRGEWIFGQQKNNASKQQEKKVPPGLLDRISFLANSTIKSESSSPSYSPHGNETPKTAPTEACIIGLQKNNASKQQKGKVPSGLLDRITFLVSGGESIPMIDGVPQRYSPVFTRVFRPKRTSESISYSKHNRGLHARKPSAKGGDGSHHSRDLVSSRTRGECSVEVSYRPRPGRVSSAGGGRGTKKAPEVILSDYDSDDHIQKVPVDRRVQLRDLKLLNFYRANIRSKTFPKY